VPALRQRAGAGVPPLMQRPICCCAGIRLPGELLVPQSHSALMCLLAVSVCHLSWCAVIAWQLCVIGQVMMAMDGIKDVHDLHIWDILHQHSPSADCPCDIGPDADANEVLQKLETYVRGIGIDHSTIRILQHSTTSQ